MKNKKRGGFSYVEILIAMALFAIMLMAVLPLLLQAGRNMGFAESNYRNHLLAQGMMLAVRDALLHDALLDDASSLGAVASTYADNHEIELYSVWIFDERRIQVGFYGASKADVFLGDEVMPLTDNSYVIVAAIWNEYGNITGRAIGIAHLGLEDKNEIP